MQEDLVTKLLEFLEKPHKTTERLLEVKEQVRVPASACFATVDSLKH